LLARPQVESAMNRRTLDPPEIRLIRTEDSAKQLYLAYKGNRMQYMSTADLARFKQVRGAQAANQARSLMHIRFTHPIINMILLLLGTPFVLTRVQGQIWDGIIKCLLVAGSCFVLSFICQQLSSDTASRTWSMAAAWLPVILFGPLAVLLFDSVKT
jgi:lipopolysaccharide export LptBFGC system permease protein LptF